MEQAFVILLRWAADGQEGSVEVAFGKRPFAYRQPGTFDFGLRQSTQTLSRQANPLPFDLPDSSHRARLDSARGCKSSSCSRHCDPATPALFECRNRFPAGVLQRNASYAELGIGVTMSRSELCRSMQLVAPQARNQLPFEHHMAFSVGIVLIVADYSPLRKANS